VAWRQAGGLGRAEASGQGAALVRGHGPGQGGVPGRGEARDHGDLSGHGGARIRSVADQPDVLAQRGAVPKVGLCPPDPAPRLADTPDQPSGQSGWGVGAAAEPLARPALGAPSAGRQVPARPADAAPAHPREWEMLRDVSGRDTVQEGRSAARHQASAAVAEAPTLGASDGQGRLGAEVRGSGGRKRSGSRRGSSRGRPPSPTLTDRSVSTMSRGRGSAASLQQTASGGWAAALQRGLREPVRTPKPAVGWPGATPPDTVDNAMAEPVGRAPLSARQRGGASPRRAERVEQGHVSRSQSPRPYRQTPLMIEAPWIPPGPHRAATNRLASPPPSA